MFILLTEGSSSTYSAFVFTQTLYMGIKKLDAFFEAIIHIISVAC